MNTIAKAGTIVKCSKGHQLYKLVNDVDVSPKALIKSADFEPLHKDLKKPEPKQEAPCCPECFEHPSRWLTKFAWDVRKGVL